MQTNLSPRRTAPQRPGSPFMGWFRFHELREGEGRGRDRTRLRLLFLKHGNYRLPAGGAVASPAQPQSAPKGWGRGRRNPAPPRPGRCES